MKVNNKLTRKRAMQRPNEQKDGTEVLHTSEARVKTRRWTFEADVSLMNVGGEFGPPMRLKMDTTIFGSAKEARLEIPRNVELMKSSSKSFEDARIRMVVVPHETVAPETIALFSRSQNMSMLLDKALELSIDILMNGEAHVSDVEKLVGAKMPKAKEIMYQMAIDFYKTQLKDPVVVEELEEERPEFVPEIVNIGSTTTPLT